MNPDNELERDLIDRFFDAVKAIPGADIRMMKILPDDPLKVDGWVDLHLRDQQFTAVFYKRKSLFPRDLRELVWNLRDYGARHSPAMPVLPVLLADTISAGARNWLRQEGVSYFDSSGSFFLAADPVYVLIEQPPTKKQGKVLGSVFEGRRPLILEALWENGREWSTVKRMAEAIDMPSSSVSETLLKLERRGWVETRGSGPAKERRVQNWEDILDQWSTHESAKAPFRYEYYYLPNAKPHDVAHKIADAFANHSMQYEIMGEYAGNIHAAHLTQVPQVRCRIPRYDHPDIGRLLNAEGVSEGWNLAIIHAEAGKEMNYRVYRDGLFLTSPLRTYLDLLRMGGRAKELARHLREVELRIQ